jgi:hypothetical protein
MGEVVTYFGIHVGFSRKVRIPSVNLLRGNKHVESQTLLAHHTALPKALAHGTPSLSKLVAPIILY